jgi:saccharopine dehydrogenase-like NADP-dependent oxidoreductase
VEELTLTPWIFERGRFREVAPRTGWEPVRFPPPVGTRWLVRTRHSEVATIPLSFKGNGLKFCDFKVGFDRAFVRELMRRLRAGQTARDFAKRPAPRGQPDDYEISRVVATGAGKSVTFDCHAQANRRWRASAGDIDTACPPSIVAQMIAAGLITPRGVLPPETAVPVGPFFDELRKRRMKIVMKESQS